MTEDVIRCCDVESTGLDPTQDAVIEIGVCDVTCTAGIWKHEDRYRSSLVRLPPHIKKVPPQASGVHHITTAMLDGAPELREVLTWVMDGVEIFAAHNAKFEAGFLALGKFICTYKVGAIMAPNAPDHKLQTLRYCLGLAVRQDLVREPHRAGGDAYTCAALLTRMLNKSTLSVEQMLEISGNPVLLRWFTFGKHANVPIAQVPADYLQWILKQDGMDEDAVHTAFTELNRRREEANGTEG